MGKNERKIEIVGKYIRNAAGNSTAYTYGKIPKSLADNACSTYAGAVQYDDIIGLIDNTVLGNARKGMIFTTSKIYYNHGILGSSGSISYKKIHETGKIPSDIFDVSYNKQALIELVSVLAKIEGENFESKLNAISSSIDGINKGVTELNDVVNKGAKLLGNILDLLDH